MTVLLVANNLLAYDIEEMVPAPATRLEGFEDDTQT